MQEYLGSLGDFKKNAHKELTPGMKKLVARRWQPSVEEFGYQM